MKLAKTFFNLRLGHEEIVEANPDIYSLKTVRVTQTFVTVVGTGLRKS